MTDYTIRQAKLADMNMIVSHRRKMFEEMGHTDPAVQAAYEPEFAAWLRRQMERGDYLAWFAVTTDGEVVAGAGLWLMDWPAGYMDWSTYRGFIFNVYTNPEHRGKGLGRRVVGAALDWSTAQGIRVVSLHPSDAGKPLYEAMGFAQTNEMRITLSPPE
ncbi:MAG: GNAT family N-acetyltransferase [Anaerolineae bacterium]|nr:GNAT family N-acetyltransferase [Anaerolineae bacterium]